jgi:hypothetical protein
MTLTASHLCYKCVGDPFLSDIVKANGERRTCLGCAKRRLGLAIDDLAIRIDDQILRHHVVNRTDEGTDYTQLVEGAAGVTSAIAAEIHSILSSTRGYDMARDGDENLYDATFDPAPLDRFAQQSRWQAFKTSVREEARFFNLQAEQWLAEIFEDIEAHADWEGQPVVRTLYPGEPAAKFYRGRVAFDEAELQAFLLSPDTELGPPPAGKASAGRMNAAGVSVFYGADELETCRAEIRPPVGAHAVFAQFELTRPVRLLDFDMLSWVAVEGSLFDPDYMRRLDRIAFLRTFGREISQPVMPRDELFGYLPTQIVAEFIAQRLGFDGMCFRSTQAGGKKRNIVLFNSACRVERLPPADDLTTRIDLGWWDEDPRDGDDSITIEELEKTEASATESNRNTVPEPDTLDGVDPRPMTLRIDPASLAVQRIDATDYTPWERTVYRRRYAANAFQNLPF